MDKDVDRAVTANAPATDPVALPDILGIYGRLLGLYSDYLGKDEFNPYQSIPLMLIKAFNPAFQIRFWKNAAPLLKVPNTLAQDLPGGAVVLQMLERLDDPTLRAIAECSRINSRNLVRRSVFGWVPKLTAAAVALVAVAKAIKEAIGVDILGSLTWFPVVPILVGLFIGSIANFVMSAPMVGFSKAVDDLIALAIAHRGGARPR
jgi:hypothetical protein